VLKVAKRLLNGDQKGVMLDALASNDLKKLWSQPDVAHKILQLPIFDSIVGMAHLGRRKLEDFTPEHVSPSHN
jgi:hypothetical protein